VAVLSGNSNRSRVVLHEDVRFAQVLIREGYEDNTSNKYSSTPKILVRLAHKGLQCRCSKLTILACVSYLIVRWVMLYKDAFTIGWSGLRKRKLELRGR
jgi:hypothetical protein